MGHAGASRTVQERRAMQRTALVIRALAISPSLASAETRPTRFWNLTRYTISEFHLAPAGTTDFGPNQCKNDKDGTVDHAERLRITGVEPGNYDARLTDASGRTCLVRKIKVDSLQIFSTQEQ